MFILLIITGSHIRNEIINIYIAFKTMHIFKSAFHYIKYYKLALNAFPKSNAQIFLKK